MGTTLSRDVTSIRFKQIFCTSQMEVLKVGFSVNRKADLWLA